MPCSWQCACPLHIAIISGARTENIRERYRMLGIEDIYLGASHKLPVLKD